MAVLPRPLAVLSNVALSTALCTSLLTALVFLSLSSDPHTPSSGRTLPDKPLGVPEIVPEVVPEVVRNYVLVNKTQHKRHAAPLPQRAEPYKVILRWTLYYGKSWGFPEGDAIFRKLQCPERRCRVSDDRFEAESAHAVLANLRDLGGPADLPKSRSAFQRWVLYNLESPYHTESNLALFNGLFNWTSTYSSESDIPSPYGVYEPYEGNSSFWQSVHAPVNHGTKSRLGAWFVTNCRAKNARRQYVEALRKNISIDVYGACGQHQCADREACFQILKQKYKFYIAFENSNCKEYITEKFWTNSLRHDILPVVMGAPRSDYERLAPPNSFLHVDDFPSPRHLARYLKILHRNAKTYRSFFYWKNQGRISGLINHLPNKSQFWCNMCAALHNSSLPTKVHWDLHKWWSVDNQCQF